MSQRRKQRWFSGRILACHAGGPGSIPGRCKSFYEIFLWFFQWRTGYHLYLDIPSHPFESSQWDDDLFDANNLTFWSEKEFRFHLLLRLYKIDLLPNVEFELANRLYPKLAFQGSPECSRFLGDILSGSSERRSLAFRWSFGGHVRQWSMELVWRLTRILWTNKF